MTTELKECDVVMKGGVTSGVVYPHFVAELSKSYRFRSIGGSSAGAIAATVTAAAEYRRQETGDATTGSFDKVADLGEKMAAELLTLFQPNPELERPFRLLLAATGKPGDKAIWWRIILVGLAVYRPFWIGPFCVSLVLALILVWSGLGIGYAMSVLLLGMIAGLATTLWRVGADIFVRLPQQDFGLCSGLGTNGKEGLSDWLHTKIQTIAGLAPDAPPLTVRDIEKYEIEVAAMTKDMSSGRPYQLPLNTRIFAFSESEFRRILPASLVNYLVAQGRRIVDEPGSPHDLVGLASGADFPVMLVARMSLSFPFLIQTVPLYRRDNRIDGHPWVRCHFSDGGISSNFPIHFFDALAPARPTFGVSLGVYDPQRDGTDDSNRYVVGAHLKDSQYLDHQALRTVASFLASILNTAKDWQDTLQARLPGYRDRNVQILLAPDEGGLNLGMPPETVKRVAAYGATAAKLLLESFDFDEHRYSRALATYPQVHEALNSLETTVAADPGYLDVLTEYDPKRYRSVPVAWRKAILRPFVEALLKLGTGSLDHPKTPASDAKLRLVADADRKPRNRSKQK